MEVCMIGFVSLLVLNTALGFYIIRLKQKIVHLENVIDNRD